MFSFPYYKQFDSMDCGPTCLRMIAKYYGKSLSLQYLRQQAGINREGVSLFGISAAAEAIGFRTLAVKISFPQLWKEGVLPCIVHWKQNHFVVVFKVSRNRVYLADPGKGIRTLTRNDFIASWSSTSEDSQPLGVVLFLEPTHRFKQQNEGLPEKLDFKIITSYFLKYKTLFLQLCIGLLIGMGLQLSLPFLTQSIVDVGISTKDVSFTTLILIGQLMIFAGSTAVDFIRSWIMLHISTRINISLLTDFFFKLMKLPLSYFDIKKVGDITQRMGDHKRIESFMTDTLLGFSFAIINFLVLTAVVIAYDIQLFLIFIGGSIIYFIWLLLFLKARKNLDYRRFDILSSNQNLTIEMIHGMQEIKLTNCEREKRWRWEHVQAGLFKVNIRSLFLNQIQQGGALFINQGKNVLITFLSAKAVIDGKLTLGGMMAIQYIIGQLNGPVQQMIQFVQALQDARISLDRINEIHQMEEEEPEERSLSMLLPDRKTIVLENVTYSYPGDGQEVLKSISLTVPEHKTTAIVGMSGSGKTTLLKLLLKFYNLGQGEIIVGGTKLSSISHRVWRSRCGVVMQEGYIFSDSIAANIAVGDEQPDMIRLLHACDAANIKEFIESLPLGLNTKIGNNGTGISQGQKQRILIARAIYKDPDYVFFDEATNSLDANNEKAIMSNLESFFNGKTVVIVAHRLSTVKKADQIVVLHKGKIAEIGTHQELVFKKGEYYNLVRNQLELEK